MTNFASESRLTQHASGRRGTSPGDAAAARQKRQECGAHYPFQKPCHFLRERADICGGVTISRYKRRYKR